jgi:hypothetical protein
MSPNISRKRRGAQTQHVVAEWFQRHGWPYAESTGAGRTGADLTGLGSLCCEVKARADFDPMAWIRQAGKHKKYPDDLPFVVWRPNGYGPQTVGEWPVMLRLDEFTALLHEAGHGVNK